MIGSMAGLLGALAWLWLGSAPPSGGCGSGAMAHHPEAGVPAEKPNLSMEKGGAVA